MRILAVDDDSDIRELLKTTIFAKTDHDIETAGSASEVLDMLEDDRLSFDCFLLDIQMPDMDGIELCKRLRSMSRFHSTPILMLTAMAQRKFVQRAFKAGATDYITKPFEIMEIQARLGNAERLVEEQKRTKRRTMEVEALRSDLDHSFDHSLGEPVEILGVERMVGYVSFENYLLQLSRMKMLTTSVCAIKILNVEKVFRNMSRVGFRTLLFDLSRMLTEIFPDDSDLITYRGNGVFACAINSKKPYSQYRVEKALNKRIKECVATRMAEVTVQVCAGEPVSLISLSRAGTLSSLQNAVTRAEIRSDNYRDILRVSSRLLTSSEKRSQAIAREERLYKALLKEAMDERRVN